MKGRKLLRRVGPLEKKKKTGSRKETMPRTLTLLEKVVPLFNLVGKNLGPGLGNTCV